MLRLCYIAFIFASVSVITFGQQKTCDLKLKVFSYDVVESSKRRLLNVSVKLKGKDTDLNRKLTGDSLNDSFTGLNEGTYKVEFQKAGYKSRFKKVELECDLIDEENGVWNYSYLWSDKSVRSDGTDLVTDENVGMAAGSASNVAALSSDNKIFGKVTIRVLIDEDGNVISATRIDGDKKLLGRATMMARGAKFSPTLIKGEPHQVTGSLTYSFVP